VKIISPIQFFSHLKWITGRSLLDVIEPYRRKIFTDVLYTFDADRVPTPTKSCAGCALGSARCWHEEGIPPKEVRYDRTNLGEKVPEERKANQNKPSYGPPCQRYFAPF
jgi:hypothetical protein